MALPCKLDIIEELFGSREIEYFSCWDMIYEHLSQSLPQPTKMSLPYTAAGSFDPPLPTAEDVARGQNIRDHMRGPHWLYRVFDKYVVKFSTSQTILQEAENLLYLEKNSKVRTPKVFAVYAHDGEDPFGWYPGTQTRFYYLVMEYITGTTLSSETWSTFDPGVQKIIGSKIAEQLKKLREVRLESDPYYGRIYKQGWDPGFNMLTLPGNKICGPYKSYEDFVDAMYETAKFRAASGIGLFSTPFSDRTLFTMINFKYSLNAVTAEDKLPTLTHLDLKLDNIMLQQDGDEYRVTIIDWECLGWMPAWVDAIRIGDRGRKA
ncbi:uncharacterized protein K460DRAFT_356804 [Cucurbitaria berberidis CBS 394.84]|uniref:Aminoglycoside phosphotransferase domain-containing protein n=1 Tax=Cucurbitaria berberidis CBS 394.84 TaxID=1168544 RepID=A0A9P4L5J4_9PLEO|nr:uncharacterized protein K460DRAFT_356804 [Cucurbitaria berberidis CBS 394.84]KAF1843021.1 hypothetical protein K460DRAFT_356804 [Cucurbitaria berberidis CBS 394.84]